MTEPTDDPAAVADCARAHIAWYTARAALPGGRRWSDVEVDWTWVAAERTAYALFPGPAPAVVWSRGLAVARRLRARSVAVWSAVDEDAPDLRAAGFERGWQPGWMSVPTAGFDYPTPSKRCRIVELTGPDDVDRGGLLGLGHTWRAEARIDGRYAGRAWIHLDGDLAGLFDMEVWPPFQRQGLGTELLGLLVRVAAEHGATRVVLNATPDGGHLYTRHGFVPVGAGRTWWRHRRRLRR